MVEPAREFDPVEFLRLAETLTRQRNVGEAEARTAISRSYYAIHLYCRKRLVETRKMKATNTGADHLLVIRTLRNLGGPHGDQLDWLRIRRTRADYNLQRRITGSEAASAVALAQALLRSLPAAGI